VSLELEYLIGLAFYAPIVATMVLETLAPRRRLVRSTGRRWLHTSGLWLVNSFLSRITLATSALAAARLQFVSTSWLALLTKCIWRSALYFSVQASRYLMAWIFAKWAMNARTASRANGQHISLSAK